MTLPTKYYQLRGGQLINAKQYLDLFKNRVGRLPVVVAKFIIKIKKATA